MTISNELNSITYNGNGSTVSFAYPFKVYADSDLLVVVTSAGGVDTTLVLNTDYTVTGAGGDSGTIVLSSGALCPSGSTITITRDMPLTQGADFVDGGAFSAETVESALDRATILLQQLKGAIQDLETGLLSSASYAAFIADMIETLDATAYLTSSYIMKSLLTTEGDTIYASAANTPARLSKGTAFQHLGMKSDASGPEWQASLQSILTTAGDILYASAANTPARLSKGTAFQHLGMKPDASGPEWQASLQSILTAAGDTIYASSANTPARLAKGGGFSITYHTYDISTASGTQTLTGAGFTPSMAVFLTGLGGGGVASGVSAKFGTFEGRMSIFNASTLTGGYMNTLFSPTTTSGNTQVGTLAFNSDGGEITWTKTGSPTGTYQIIAIWFR